MTKTKNRPLDSDAFLPPMLCPAWAAVWGGNLCLPRPITDGTAPLRSAARRGLQISEKCAVVGGALDWHGPAAIHCWLLRQGILVAPKPPWRRFLYQLPAANLQIALTAQVGSPAGPYGALRHQTAEGRWVRPQLVAAAAVVEAEDWNCCIWLAAHGPEPGSPGGCSSLLSPYIDGPWSLPARVAGFSLVRTRRDSGFCRGAKYGLFSSDVSSPGELSGEAAVQVVPAVPDPRRTGFAAAPRAPNGGAHLPV